MTWPLVSGGGGYGGAARRVCELSPRGEFLFVFLRSSIVDLSPFHDPFHLKGAKKGYTLRCTCTCTCAVHRRRQQKADTRERPTDGRHTEASTLTHLPPGLALALASCSLLCWLLARLLACLPLVRLSFKVGSFLVSRPQLHSAIRSAPSAQYASAQRQPHQSLPIHQPPFPWVWGTPWPFPQRPKTPKKLKNDSRPLSVCY